MIKFFAGCVIFAYSLVFAFAQNSETDNIRERYNQIQEQIAEGMMQPVLLEFDINRPAIGMQKISTSFYWNNWSSEYYGEDDKGNVAYQVSRRLAMVVTEYNIAASEYHHYEYVYDEDGKLIFFFQRIAGENIGEIRLYFSKSTLIKEISRTYTRNDDNSNGSMSDELILTTGFTAEIKKLAGLCADKAEKYKQYFITLFEVEGLK